jgi:chorismate dehydratase
LPRLSPKRLRVAAIGFLNPAPLMWDFEHVPASERLALRYKLHSTQPAQCARDLLEGRADVGLVPVAALTGDLAVVPGCTIASLGRVRSIQLIVKLRGNAAGPEDETLRRVRTVAADTASLSSLAYAQVLFRRFVGAEPRFLAAPADPVEMLTGADAALLIGDPALLALEGRERIEAHPGIGPCVWLDLAEQWHRRTGLPWVAAVWAVRAEALGPAGVSREELVEDLQRSRDHGLAHIDELVKEWTPRIALPPSTIRDYLTQSIHYTLDPECVQAIELFRAYAAEAGILPPLAALQFL